MDKYQIIPKKKIGLFILNSTMSDNKHLNNQYGKITYEGIMGASAKGFDTLKEIYSKLGLDTTDIDEVKDFYLNGEKNTLYQVSYETGISLIYENEKLREITVYKECEGLNFNNHYIFKENP